MTIFAIDQKMEHRLYKQKCHLYWWKGVSAWPSSECSEWLVSAITQVDGALEQVTARHLVTCASDIHGHSAKWYPAWLNKIINLV